MGWSWNGILEYLLYVSNPERYTYHCYHSTYNTKLNMNESEKMTIENLRAPGLEMLEKALENVVLSSPEALTKLADALEKELRTLDTDADKEVVKKVVESMRVASAAL